MMPSMNFPWIHNRGWQQHLAEALQILQQWPWRDTVRTLRERFRDDRLGITAGSLTFTTTIAMVPLLTVTLAVFSAFPIFASFQGALEKYFLQSLVPNSIARPVLGALTQFATKANRLGFVGLVVLLVTALALMLTIDRTLNAIWRVRKPRPIAQRVLVYWAAVSLGPLLLGASLTLTSYAVSASQGFVGDMPGSVAVLLNLLQFVTLSGAIACLYRFVPNTYVRWGDAWSGAIFVTLGFEVAKRLLGWYVSTVPTYSAVYGAFATLPIFLVWVYLGWVIVLLGAVIAAYAPSIRLRVVRRAVVPGYRFHLALNMLRELADARHGGSHGLSAAALSASLRTDPLQIEPILDILVSLDWAGRLEEDGRPRYVLLCDPAGTPAQPLLTRLLLDLTPSVSGFWRKAGFERMTLADLLAPGHGN
jgi:membrane protein